MATKDELIADYLDNMAEYKLNAEKSGQEWSEGFIGLSQAQLTRSIGQHNYDLNMKPAITVINGQLEFSKDVDSLGMFGGAFAPQSLKQAQKSFQQALENTLLAHNSLKKVCTVETALKNQS